MAPSFSIRQRDTVVVFLLVVYCCITSAAPFVNWVKGTAPPPFTAVGHASIQNTQARIRLTNSQKDRGGAAWFGSPSIRTSIQSGFDASFTFVVQPNSYRRGADGLAFVMQTQGPTALGGLGHRRGFTNIRNGFAIAFDVYFGSQNYNHVQLYGMKTSESQLANVPCSVYLDNGADVHVRVLYFLGRIKVFVGGVLYIDTDFQHSTWTNNADVYVGFTAATGTYYAAQTITSFSMDIPPIVDAFAPLLGIGYQLVVNVTEPILSSGSTVVYRAEDSVSGALYNCAFRTASSLTCTLTRTKPNNQYQEHRLTLQVSGEDSWQPISSTVQHYSLGTAPTLTATTKIYNANASSIVDHRALPPIVQSFVKCSIDGTIVDASPLTDSSYECSGINALPGSRSVSLKFIQPSTETDLAISNAITMVFVDMDGSIVSAEKSATFVPDLNLNITTTGIRIPSSSPTISFFCRFGPSSSPTQYRVTVKSMESLTPETIFAEGSSSRFVCHISTTAQSVQLAVSVWMQVTIGAQITELRITSNSQLLYLLPKAKLFWDPSQVKAAYTTASPVLATIMVQNGDLHQDIGTSNTIYCRNLESRTQTTFDTPIQWVSANSIKCNIASQLTTKVTTSLWYKNNGEEFKFSTQDVQFAFINSGSAADQIGDTEHPYPNAAIIRNDSMLPVMFNVGFDASVLIAATPAMNDVYVCRYHDGNPNPMIEAVVSTFTSDGLRTNFTCEFEGTGYLPLSQTHAINITLWIKVNGEELRISDSVFRFYFIRQADPSWFDDGVVAATSSLSAPMNVKLEFAVSNELLQKAVCAQSPISTPNAHELVHTSIVTAPGLRMYTCTLSRPSPIGSIELSVLFPVRNSPAGFLEITSTRLAFTFLPLITLVKLSPSVGSTTTGLNTLIETDMPTSDFVADISFRCRWNNTAHGDNSTEGSSNAVWDAQSGTFSCTVSAADSQRMSLSVTTTVHGATLVLSENTLIATLVRPTAAEYAASNTPVATMSSEFDAKIRVPFSMDANMIAKTSCKQSGVDVPLQRPPVGDGVYICSLSRAIASSLNGNAHPITLWYTDEYGDSVEITRSGV